MESKVFIAVLNHETGYLRTITVKLLSPLLHHIALSIHDGTHHNAGMSSGLGDHCCV
jgi:hypothetical protein